MIAAMEMSNSDKELLGFGLQHSAKKELDEKASCAPPQTWEGFSETQVLPT
jgi:hypothetical protein